jgi:two-component system capsular synthesis sensor histidine kinase RcsC
LSARLRVLVAEDDALLREILCEELAAQGFAVEATEDGQDALDRFRAGAPFDVILLDEEMPGMTGRAFLTRIRSEGHRVPALIISGNLHLDAEECAALGIGPVLRKPISFDDLAAALREAAAPGGRARV